MFDVPPAGTADLEEFDSITFSHVDLTVTHSTVVRQRCELASLHMSSTRQVSWRVWNGQIKVADVMEGFRLQLERETQVRADLG